MAQLDIFSLEGKVALIPGGSGAIGAAIGEAFAGAGAKVAISGRHQETCDAAIERIRAAGSEGIAIAADSTVEDDADRMVRETVDAFGRIDIVVNAVGGGAGKVLHPAEAYPRSDWDWIMELNVRSTIVPTEAGGPVDARARRRRRGPQPLVGPREPRHQRRLLGLMSRPRARSAR